MSNSADNRSVATDALHTLGTIIGESEKRDAIHLAVFPAVAAHTLRPGDDVGLVEGNTAGVCDNPLGIVDPFLKEKTVKQGQRFWLIVYPRKITSLRHVWEHPGFPAATELGAEPASQMSKSEAWLRNYAASLPVKYDELLYRAKDWVENGERWNEGGRFEGEYIPDEFWPHYEAVTGMTVAADNRGSFFSCSC